MVHIKKKIIIIITKSYRARTRIYQTRYSRHWVYKNFQKDRLLQWWILRPNYLAHYNVLRRTQQPQPGTPGRTLLVSISALGSFTCVTQHMGPTALRQQWLSVLLKDTSVTASDSNPHSADQKHQILNSVILTARPRHFQDALIASLHYSHYILINLLLANVTVHVMRLFKDV